MKSTVYIHPGLPKTGTTAIQKFLRDNAEALNRKGVAYPLFPRKFKGVHLERNGHFFSGFVTDTDFKNACLQEIIQLAEHFDKIILTDEELWSSACNQPEFWMGLKATLNSHDIDLKMIVYLRRQDAFMASLWAQKIKGVKLRYCTFKLYLEEESYDVDYYDYLERIAAVIGRDHIIVRPYEFSQFKGKDSSIVSDFLMALDIDYDDSLVFKNERHNISLGGNVLEVKRHMNRVEAFRPKAHRTLKYYTAIQEEWMKKKKYHDCSTFLGNHRANYMKQFEEGNRRVAIDYLGRSDGILFTTPLPTNDPEKRHYTYEEMRAILKLLQKKLNKDPHAPFTKEEFQMICDETWGYIQESNFYVHKHPKLKAIERRIKSLFGAKAQ